MAVYAGMASADQRSVRDWVSSMGGAALFDLDLPRMRRDGLKALRVNS